MADCSDQEDLFKEEFKAYKKSSGGHIRNVIDVRTPENCISELTQFFAVSEDPTIVRFGLRPPQEWKCYHINSVPGLIVIPDPFIPGGQIHWVGRCLVEYPHKPNICNLDAHKERSGQGRLWPKLGSSEPSASSKVEVNQTHVDEVKDPEKVQLKHTKLSVVDGTTLSKDSGIYRLRWVTLGYHYDWNTKEYYRERWSSFPVDMGEMATAILKVCGFPNFHAEAGIVNYYHMDSTLSGHTDHSEKDLSHPLLSLSFGQSAIFLIGGPTKQVRPKALLLNSGDIVIMSGQSRLAYHGVPKNLSHFRGGVHSQSFDSQSGVPRCLTKQVFEAYLESQSSCGVGHTEMFVEQSGSAECRTSSVAMDKRGCSSCEELIKTWHLFESYISTSRINVNIRQVTSEKCTF